MQRSLLSYPLVLIVLVTGCSSFNNSFNTYAIPSTSEAKAAEMRNNKPEEEHLSIAVDDRLNNDKCSSFVFPITPITPTLPLKEIIAANGDAVLIERIERKHIDDLRMFISNIRKEQIQAQSEYQALCGGKEKT